MIIRYGHHLIMVDKRTRNISLYCWLFRAFSQTIHPMLIICTSHDLFLVPPECVFVYFIKRPELQMHFFFTSEPDTFCNWNWSFSIEADNLEQSLFSDYYFHNGASLLVVIYCFYLSAKDVEDWGRHTTTMYYGCCRVKPNLFLKASTIIQYSSQYGMLRGLVYFLFRRIWN